MRYFILFALFLTTVNASAAPWVPPKKPDPQAILQEAEKDRAAKKYADSLAKYIWIHENSLAVQPSFVGVRVSFAIAGWHKLAQEYPPAMNKFKEYRDLATDAVKDDATAAQSFMELSGFNTNLKEETKTKDIFAELDRRKPKIAKQVFGVAKPALIKEKEYTLYAKYIDPKLELAQAIMMRTLTAPKDAKKPTDKIVQELSDKRFTNNVATLIAILVLSDRNGEAQEIAKSARGEWEDKSFQKAIDEALKGTLPNA